MTAFHGLGVCKGLCGFCVSPYGGLSEPKRVLPFLFSRRSVSPERLPHGQIGAAQTGEGGGERQLSGSY